MNKKTFHICCTVANTHAMGQNVLKNSATKLPYQNIANLDHSIRLTKTGKLHIYVQEILVFDVKFRQSTMAKRSMATA